jgi:pSer/pThr/pTyr-binding forkhead associated (FHA) protein
MAVCPNCGKDNAPQYKFCLGCGGELTVKPAGAAASKLPAAASTMVPEARAPGTAPPVFGDMGPDDEPATAKTAQRRCPNCSTQVAGGFRFCPSCGGPMEDEAPKPRAARSQAPTQGRMILMRPDGSEGGVYLLSEGENLIGRTTGPLFDADGYLSPRHAQIVLNAAGAVVRDLGSLNGVFMKIAPSELEELRDGSVFRIGQELLRFDAIPEAQPLDDGTEVLGSPNPGYWGRLALIVGKDQDGSAFPLMGDAVVLGRERGDVLFPEDGYVSGTHARVTTTAGRFYLNDLNSSNGTFIRINGERPLASGGFVLIGQQLFRVVY